MGGESSDDDVLPVLKIPKPQRAEDVGTTDEYKAMEGETIGHRLTEVRGKYLDDQRQLHKLYLEEEEKLKRDFTSDSWDGAEWRGPRWNVLTIGLAFFMVVTTCIAVFGAMTYGELWGLGIDYGWY